MDGLDFTNATLTVQNVTTSMAAALAAAAVALLDQALGRHTLLPAFLHRARLGAVRRQAAVDGKSIDAWRLAAVIEGLQLVMPGPPSSTTA